MLGDFPFKSRGHLKNYLIASNSPASIKHIKPHPSGFLVRARNDGRKELDSLSEQGMTGKAGSLAVGITKPEERKNLKDGFTGDGRSELSAEPQVATVLRLAG